MNEFLNLPEGVVPMPRSGVCAECGGPANIYEAGLQDTPDGIICGECARRKERRMGRDPRKIDRHHRFKGNEQPGDDDADPNSPFVYLNLEQVAAPETPRQKGGLGGPPAGVLCFNCLAHGRGKVEARLADAVDPYSLLEPTGYKQAEGTKKTEEKVIITICPTCSSITHWRESEFKRARARHGFA